MGLGLRTEAPFPAPQDCLGPPEGLGPSEREDSIHLGYGLGFGSSKKSPGDLYVQTSSETLPFMSGGGGWEPSGRMREVSSGFTR